MTDLQRETEIIPKSFIRVSNRAHDIVSLLELLKRNQIRVLTVYAQNTDPDAFSKVGEGEIPSVDWSQIEVVASHNTIRTILETSDEFRQDIEGILGLVD